VKTQIDSLRKLKTNQDGSSHGFDKLN
jgi:hypothetical protein